MTTISDSKGGDGATVDAVSRHHPHLMPVIDDPEASGHQNDSLWRRVIRSSGVVGVLSIASAIGIWWIVSLFLSPVILPSPFASAKGLYQIAANGVLGPAIVVSLREMYIGLALGVASGVLIGTALGAFARVDRVVMPYVNVLNSVPGVILIPSIVIWFGLGSATRIFFIVLITVWPMVINTRAGIMNSATRYRDLSKVFGYGRFATIRKVLIPASTPYLIAGLRISMGLAIVGMIIGEFEVSYTGLGYLLISFGESLQTGRLIGVVFLAAMIGLVQVGIIRIVESRFLPWIKRA